MSNLIKEVKESTDKKHDEMTNLIKEVKESTDKKHDEMTNIIKEMKELIEECTVKACNAGATTTLSRPRDCFEVQEAGSTESGLYDIYPDEGTVLQVYCDMETDGGGWTVFQRREDGHVDFYRDWKSYKEGFGNPESEFWLGNDNLFKISNQGNYELRVDMQDFDDESRFAHYSHFGIGDESTKYTLTLSGYDGDAGDSLTFQANRPFTTKDQDNDSVDINCAELYTGAWWYNSCHYSNLNGQYLAGEFKKYATGVVWRTWRGYHYSLQRTEMKMRPTKTTT